VDDDGGVEGEAAEPEGQSGDGQEAAEEVDHAGWNLKRRCERLQPVGRVCRRGPGA
jgi:hypothetical protein